MIIWTFFGIALLGDLKWKLTFSNPVATVLQIFWHIECSTLTASSRVLNSSARSLSSPLALFVVMLSKAHLTSHSRMSSSSWVTTPLWLSGLLRPFWYCSFVYSCYLFLIFSTSVRSLQFLSFIVPILAWSVPLIPPFFLKRSLVFPILLFSSISLHCSFKAFLSLLAIDRVLIMSEQRRLVSGKCICKTFRMI